MSKGKTPTQDTSAYKNYSNYLKGYDTGNVDYTLGSLTQWARDNSNQLNNMGNYTFNVNASDEARQQAQDATFNTMMNYVKPEFEAQASDLATSLQNKGIPVGSEAYNRAMSNLQDNQNQAITQASNQAILTGQQAYSQDLANQINAGNFGNTAQQMYINQLLSALQGSASGYENQQNIFSVDSAKSAIDYQNALAKAQSKSNLGAGLGSLGGAVIGGYFGGPLGASIGSSIGGSIGGNIV